MTLITGKVTTEHVSEEKFIHDYPLALPEYPLLRAVKMYATSGLDMDEMTEKVLRLLARM